MRIDGHNSFGAFKLALSHEVLNKPLCVRLICSAPVENEKPDVAVTRKHAALIQSRQLRSKARFSLTFSTVDANV